MDENGWRPRPTKVGGRDGPNVKVTSIGPCVSADKESDALLVKRKFGSRST